MLITGSSGKLGKQLIKVFPKALAPTHAELDITNRDAVFGYIKKHKPDKLLHLAALAGIRECEENKKLAWEVNVDGTRNLVKACLNFHPACYFVYISTACVFSGDKGNYSEDDIPYPKNFYSLTKLLGEFVVQESDLKKWLIIRTNFVERAEWSYERAFADRYGTYLFADDLALAIADVVQKNLIGIVHVCGEEKLSMLELARLTTPEVKAMTIAEYKGPPVTIDMSLRSIRLKPYRIRKVLQQTRS